MLQLWYWFNKFDVFEKYICPETKKNTNRSQQSLLVNGRSGNNLARGMLNPVSLNSTRGFHHAMGPNGIF